MARIIVHGGSVVWTGATGRGGHIVYVLQWLEGLRRLGHEVLYHDVIEEGPEPTALFADIFARAGSGYRASAILASGVPAFGPGPEDVEAFARDAAVVSLGCTFGDLPPWLAPARPRILIDQDPAFTQLWAEGGGVENVIGVHDVHFTVGANIGAGDCPVPTLGIDWRPIWNPVVLDWWGSPHSVARDRFTTVAGLWLNGYVEFEGRLWGPKADRLEAFLPLPTLASEAVEIAVERKTGSEQIDRLREHGWRVESAEEVASTAEDYRHYVSSSAGEFSCAKGLYVGTRSGWFSDRSACYLAAGRPVVVEDTGFSSVLPTGLGLFAVKDVAEAAEAIRAIRSDYPRHSQAAREIAAEHFDAGRVLPALFR